MTLSMRPEIRDAWADALESGEYTQTKGVLAIVDDNGIDADAVAVGMCCLGVLCHLAVKAGVIKPPRVVPTDEYGDCFEYGAGEHASHSGLPPEVAAWAGLNNGDGGGRGFMAYLSDPILTRFDEDGQPVRRSAASWNDDYDASFADIAVMVRQIEPSV